MGASRSVASHEVMSSITLRSVSSPTAGSPANSKALTMFLGTVRPVEPPSAGFDR